MKGTVTSLRSWIMQRIKSGKILDPDRLQRLYNHYHRIKLWEARTYDTGPRGLFGGRK